MINTESNTLFLRERIKDGVSDATIQKDQRHLNVFFMWLYSEGLIPKEIKFRKRRVEGKQPEIYREEDLERLADILQDNPQWMRIYMMARYAVMRSGEIWSLPLSRIDLRKRTITIGDVPELEWTVKTRTRRAIPIGKNLYPFLEKDLGSRKPNERWFLDNGNGFPAYGSSWSLTQIFRRRCRKLGIVGPKPLHGIRSLGITKMLLDSGGRAELVASIAGHSVAVMLKHYARITEEDSRGVIDLL
jgi:integrase